MTAVEPHGDDFEVRVTPGAGLSALISMGANTATEAGDPLGVLALELPPAEQRPSVSVEVFFAHQGALRLIERLDVRVLAELGTTPGARLTGRVLETFGGTAFTNLVLRRSDGHEVCDLSVSSAPPVRLLARNTLLAGDGLAPEEIARCRETFELFGLTLRSAAALSVPTRQLRRAPTLEDQVRTYVAGCERFSVVELFASPLPPAQSARLAFHASERTLDVTLTRSNLEHASLAKRAMDQMQALLTEQFAFGFDDTTWRGHNFHAERQPFESRGVVPERPNRGWSLNWNARSR